MTFWWWGYAKMMEIVQEAIEVKYKSVTGNTDVTTSSLTYVTMDGMTLTVTTGANPVLIFAYAPCLFIGAGSGLTRIVIDGVEKAALLWFAATEHNYWMMWMESLSAGEHTIAIQWCVELGTDDIYQQGTSYPRQLIILELEGATEL